MSQELVTAAQNGNLSRVMELLQNSSININYIGQYHRGNARTLHRQEAVVSGSALLAAINNGQYTVANYLLKQGAKVEVDSFNANGYLYDDAVFMNAMCRTTDTPFDLNLLKLLLSKCREVNPKIVWSKGGYEYYLAENFVDSRCTLNDKAKRFSYFMYEAVLRNDTFTLSRGLEKSSKQHGMSAEFSEETFREYLGDRAFTAAQALQANKGVDTLVDGKFIIPAIAVLIKKLIDRNVVFKIEAELFPRELQEALKQRPPKGLPELFAELQSLLYPEEGLPRVVVDDNFNFAGYTKTTEEIREWQHPRQLRRLLEMDESAVLMRLNCCATENGLNPAAILLAEILLRFHSAKISNIDGREETFLHENQQKIAMKMLTRLYSMTDMEKILLSANRQQFLLLMQVQAQNRELATGVHEVKDKMNIMMKMLMQMRKPEATDESAQKKPAVGLMFNKQ